MSNSQIKWFSSTNKNAPALANTWGSLLALFQACFVDGYSSQNVSSVSLFTAADNSYTMVTFTYLAVHNYSQYQILNVSGSTVNTLNGDFRILNVSQDGLSLTFKVKAGIADAGTVLNIFTKLAPLGWENVYSETGRAVYKTTSENDHNHCFFVQDKLNTGYTTTYAKYATTALAEDIDVGFTPKGLSFPQDISLLDGSGSGATFKLGSGKIMYACNMGSGITNGTFTPTSVPPNGDREWILIGTNEYFYLYNTVHPGTVWGQLSSFGIYDSVHQGFKYSSYISNMLWDDQLANNAANLSIDAGGLSSTAKFIKSLSSYARPGLSNLLLNSYNGMSYSGNTNILSSSGPVNLFKVFLRETSSVLMGTLKGFYWIAQQTPYAHKQIFKQGSNIFLALSIYSSNNVTQVAISLGDPNE